MEPAACTPGSYSAGQRAYACTLCAAGKYQPERNATVCVRCAPGSFFTEGSSLDLPAACGPSTFANTTDADDNPNCFDYPPGSFCPGGAAAPKA